MTEHTNAVARVTVEGVIWPACRACGGPNRYQAPLCGCGRPFPESVALGEVDVDNVDEVSLLGFWRQFRRRMRKD